NKTLPAEQQIVTAHPDIEERQINLQEDEFFVLACDGIWDCMSNDQVVSYVRQRVAGGQTLTQICESMMENCLAHESDTGGYGCDNMTVIIVAILNGKTYEEWQEGIKARVPVELHVGRAMDAKELDEEEEEKDGEEEEEDEEGREDFSAGQTV
ncbi:Protein phosphatase 2C 2, partial [Chytridiales sp. JEL 0842]